MTAWLFVMVVSLRQSYAWHSLLLLPWLVIRSPDLALHKTGVADTARLAVVITLSVVVFRNPLVPSWLGLVP